jgi:HAD superfamily hydrolase (TIGR01509 family)
VLPALFGLVVVLTACRADVVVDVVVEPDGSGEVVASVILDPEATAALIDVGRGLPLEDLAQAGWRVEPPEATDGGGTALSAAKGFGTPEQFAVVMEELDGADGLFQAFQLQRIKSFARVDHRLTGRLDPTGGFDQFADADLVAALGTTLDDLAAQGGASPAGVVVRLRADLPGDVRDATLNATPGPEGELTWVVSLADPVPVEVDVATTSRLVAPLVLRGVAVVAAVLAALVLLGQGLRLLRPESRRRPVTDVRPRVAARATAASPTALSVPPPDGTDDQPAPSAPKVVALDAMGVLYREGDDVNRLLIPFARERGSLLTDKELTERARALSLGRITTSEFWSQVGAIGDPPTLSQEYLGLHQLSPGVVKFLRALRQREIRAACITNDAASWATALRRRHSLEGLIDLWVISGAVGVRKPDPPIFEALRRVAQVPAGDILMIDDDVVNLDSARSLGFRTAWYSPDGAEADANGHAVLRSLDIAAGDVGPVAQERTVGA